MSTRILVASAFAAAVLSSAAVGPSTVARNNLETNGDSKDLVVLLHAFTKDAASLEHIRAVLKDQERFPGVEGFQDADILAPDLPFGTFSMAKPAEVVADLISQIDQAWTNRLAEGEPYRRILFVGHSMGALYARKIYVAACGENPEEAPFEKELKEVLAKLGAAGLDEPRPWAEAVQRIVLLAGMNRGWSISHHMSLTRAAIMTLGVGAGHVISWFRGRPPIIFSIRRGSPFITQLRIQWLTMLDNVGKKSVGDALTVQLLGTVDDLVSPRDNIDLITGEKFVYLDVPESGHESVIHMDDSLAGRRRAEVFVTAVATKPEPLMAMQIIPADATLTKRPEVTDVVFVIHGIRDEGFWTQKIARRVIAKGREMGKVVASETSNYGYFPMLSFLHPGARQAKVEWLMDQYTEALAIYPNAEFSFVGHSNGTYLLAKALEDYPAASFKHVVFAGSVVHREFDWSRFIPRQAEAVLNFVASSDWVVAYFPKALQTLHVQDLGSAGHDGFAVAAKHPKVYELDREYVLGGHSAALKEAIWDSIAEFILKGQFEPPPGATLSGKPTLSDKQAWWVSYPAKVAPLLWVVGALILAAILWGLLKIDLAQWVKTLVIVSYFWVIWTVLTKV